MDTEKKSDSRIFGENAGLFPEGAVGLKPKRKQEEADGKGGFGKNSGLFEPKEKASE